MAEANQGLVSPGTSAASAADTAKGAGIVVLLAAVSALLAILSSNPVVPFALGGALVAGLIMLWHMVRPIRIVRALFTFLPFHIVFMVMFFGLLGLPEGVVRGLASWKEAVLVFFVIAVLLGIVLSGKKNFPMSATDIFGLLFSAQVALYVVLAPALGSSISLVGRLYGLRDSTMILCCYFLGRAFALGIEDLEKLLKLIMTVGLVTVGLGLLEWIFLPDSFFVLLGVSTYYKDFLGVNYAGDDWGQGLPGNFWQYLPGYGYARRSVSVYMSSQGYAVTFLILIPIATYFLLSKPGRKNLWVFLIHGFGLISTITRATILTCTILFFMMAKMTGRVGWVSKGLLAATALFLGGLVFSQGVRNLVMETLTFKSDSSVSHLSSWASSIDPIMERPIFGHGLSEAGQNSKRFGGKNVGEESTPLRILGETGTVGFLLFSGFWFSYILQAYGVTRSSTADARAKGLSALGIALCVGFLINGIATDIMASLYTNFSTGILMGLIRSTVKAAPQKGTA